MVHHSKVWVVYVFSLFVATFALEKLPPHAYFNRTMYPPLQNYTSKKPHLAIGILSDIQFANQEETKRRHFKLSTGKLAHAIDEMNANRTHLDLVIHLGDLVDNSLKKYLPVLEPILKRLKYPFYEVLGNHDFLLSPEDSFKDIHKLLGMPGKYYSLNAGPGARYRLVILDGNDIALYSTVSGSKTREEANSYLRQLKRRRAKNANQFNGAIGKTQIEWMKNELQDATDKDQRVIIFLHHPMRPTNEVTNLWNDLEIVPIITWYPCVLAVVNGHAHKFMYDFHHAEYRNVHFITFGGMVQSPFTSWGFIDVYEDELHVHGLEFGRAIDNHYNTTMVKRVPIPSMSTTDASGVSTNPVTVVSSEQSSRRPEIPSESVSLAPDTGNIAVDIDVRSTAFVPVLTVVFLIMLIGVVLFRRRGLRRRVVV